MTCEGCAGAVKRVLNKNGNYFHFDVIFKLINIKIINFINKNSTLDI